LLAAWERRAQMCSAGCLAPPCSLFLEPVHGGVSLFNFNSDLLAFKWPQVDYFLLVDGFVYPKYIIRSNVA
jgi:hypothetical protein